MHKLSVRLTLVLSLVLVPLGGMLLFLGSKASTVKADKVAHPHLASVLTTTIKDFFLPGTQPNILTDTIAVPLTCDGCHTDAIYNRWRGSMMSQSARDPLMWSALAIANEDAPGAGEFCLRCHVAKGWLEGRSTPTDGSAFEAADLEAGVACEICHRLVDPVPSTTDEAVAIDNAIRAQLELSGTLPLTSHQASGMMIIDPEDNRRGPFSFAAPPPHPKKTLQTDLMNQAGDSVSRSRLCGTCHNVENPSLSWNEMPPDGGGPQFWPNQVDQPAPSFAKGQLFPIEQTFDEWLNSDYPAGVFAPEFAGQKPDGIVSACQDCHMPRLIGRATDFNSVLRDCETTGCLPEHELVGGNTWVPQLLQDSRWRLNSLVHKEALDTTVVRAKSMLQRAATLTATLTTSGSTKIATVRVTNESGHKLPTGYPEGRRMWLNLRAYNANNVLIYESGHYDPQTGDLTLDSAIKVYEAKLGVTPELAARLNLPPGESFHFVLNNVYLKDNRIPPRGYTQAAFDRPGLRPVGASYEDGQYWDETTYTVPEETDYVIATLYYQTSSKEYIDFLRNNGGDDGNTLGQLWDSLKSPPEVMVVAPSRPGVGQGSIFLPVVLK